MLAASQEVDTVGGYRTHTSAPANYGGQYGSVYGSAALSVAPQVRVLWYRRKDQGSVSD